MIRNLEAEEAGPLRLIQNIQILRKCKGCIDDTAVDLKAQRLFIACVGEQYCRSWTFAGTHETIT